MAQQFPAGWYRQPDGTQRFWDGSQWTNHVTSGTGPSPTAAPQVASPQPGQTAGTAKKPWFKKKRVIFPVVALAAIVALGATQGKGGAVTAAPAPTASAPVTATATESPTVAAADEPSEEPAAEPSEDTETEAPIMTVSQEQAVSKAESYIEYTAFSRAGLIKQLKYEGFSTKDSTFAVDHIEVDWMEQAALKAKSYLEYTSFSRSGLIRQLKYEGFTTKQATHGANAVGL